mgnify:CR=1
ADFIKLDIGLLKLLARLKPINIAIKILKFTKFFTLTQLFIWKKMHKIRTPE